MNRTDRLLAIVLELQAKRKQRAEDLAATFEVNRRTIYRDMQALSEAGVPIVSVTGQGYSLAEGYFLPPLAFTPDEAIMLLLGSDFMAQHFDAQYRSAARNAHSKIEAVLPAPLQREVRYLQNSIRFIAPAALKPAESELLKQVRRAIVERKTVRFHYTKRVNDGDEPAESQREADPYGLAHFGSAWMMIAYCHLRKDARSFRLDRMDSLSVLNKIFTRPANFTMQRDPNETRNLVVRAQFDQQSARWAQESPSFYMVSAEPNADGLLVTLRARRADDVFQWVLSWGAHVRVLEPKSLRERIKQEAEQMLANA